MNFSFYFLPGFIMKRLPWKKVRRALLRYFLNGLRLVYDSYSFRKRKESVDVSQVAFDLFVVCLTLFMGLACWLV